ncbi:hypothetical protein [Nocardioides sp. SYSU DS0663]|uniref:hypothetical protein n=1 Tax=Nocardioides sp. SYSU DS0663 TaxID=3416445 RepID=UPI003F4B1C27
MVVALTMALLFAPSSIGQFGLLASSASFVGAAGLLGLAPLVTRQIAASDGGGTQSSVAGYSLAVTLMMTSTIALGVSVLVLGPASQVLPSAIATPTAVGTLSLWGFGLALNPLIYAISAGYRAFGICTALGIVRSVLVATGTIAGGAMGGGGAGLALGAAGGELCAALAGVSWLYRRALISRPRGVGGEARGSLLKQGFVSGSASFGIQGAMWAGLVWLASSESGLGGTAAFVLINRFLLLVTLYPTALASTSLPSIASLPPESRRRRVLYRRMWRLGSLSTFPAVCCVVIIGVVVLPILDSSYGEYRWMFIVMAVVGGLMALNNVIGAVAVGTGRITAWVVSDWVLGAVLVIMAAFAIPQWGALGLAISHLAAYGASIVALALGSRPTSTHPRTP